ncbi:c-type cytochrome [Daejeonella oryzae]|uniref:c-type cytochrome n=1 Tax=Daejeonella oryzae TaxID=1122943 RepID=UPI0003FDE1A9|nr:c-type cytochrome [Daejeonella oryzae]
MKNSSIIIFIGFGASVFLMSQCADKGNKDPVAVAESEKPLYQGFESKEKLGEHLVLIAGCHDCHTPKKMSANGPELDFSLALSGHPSQMPAPNVDRRDMENKGLVVTQTLTSWVGPWGVSYAANLTPDSTGIGMWKEENFLTAIRKGKFKGLETGRTLLPPMPWQMYQNMTDEELSAIFAYLKSIKPIKNVVPQPNMPVLARK